MVSSNGKPTSDLVLLVENTHCDGSGSPPGIVKRQDDDTYTGYFENDCGEQWTLEVDRRTKTGILRGGDLGWDRLVTIRDNRIEDDDLVVSRAETKWLSACWEAATGQTLQPLLLDRVLQLADSVASTMPGCRLPPE